MENYDTQDGPKPGTPYVRALAVIIPSGGLRISFVNAHRSPGSMPSEDLEVYHFFSAVAVTVANLLYWCFLRPLRLNWPTKHPLSRFWA